MGAPPQRVGRVMRGTIDDALTSHADDILLAFIEALWAR